jgi:hypothetical protein
MLIITQRAGGLVDLTQRRLMVFSSAVQVPETARKFFPGGVAFLSKIPLIGIGIARDRQ